MLEFTEHEDGADLKMWVMYHEDVRPEVLVSMVNESFPIRSRRDLDLLIEELQKYRDRLAD